MLYQCTLDSESRQSSYSGPFGLKNWNPWSSSVVNSPMSMVDDDTNSACTRFSNLSDISYEPAAGSLHKEMILQQSSNHNNQCCHKNIRDVQDHKTGRKNTKIITNLNNENNKCSKVTCQVLMDTDSNSNTNNSPSNCDHFPLKTHRNLGQSPLKDKKYCGVRRTAELKASRVSSKNDRDCCNNDTGNNIFTDLEETFQTIESHIYGSKDVEVQKVDVRNFSSYNNATNFYYGGGTGEQTTTATLIENDYKLALDSTNSNSPTGVDDTPSKEEVTSGEATPGEGESIEGDEEESIEDDEEEGENSESSDIMMEMEPEAKDASKKERKKLNIAHLDKEGLIIGVMNIFADIYKREYIIPLNDEIAEAFLVDPGRFRAVANRTKCEIELSRRLLCRRMGAYRWVKYLILQIRGPSISSVNQCDMLMIKTFPLYKIRKEYTTQASVTLYVKENVPDNTDLYFNYQRTGPCSKKIGEMVLTSPFGLSDHRPLENAPWKMTNKKLYHGCLEPRNINAEHSLHYVYPEWGEERVDFVGNNFRWEKAADYAVEVERRREVERKLRVKTRQLNAEPLFLDGGK